MKSIIMLHMLFLVFSFASTVHSHPHHKLRLYDLIHKTMNKDTDTLLLAVRHHKYVRSTTNSPVDQLMANEEENQVQQRDSWDSGEDHYFKWASLNRRPMESLAGRKRSIVTSRHSRLTDGI